MTGSVPGSMSTTRINIGSWPMARTCSRLRMRRRARLRLDEVFNIGQSQGRILERLDAQEKRMDGLKSTIDAMDGKVSQLLREFGFIRKAMVDRLDSARLPSIRSNGSPSGNFLLTPRLASRIIRLTYHCSFAHGTGAQATTPPCRATPTAPPRAQSPWLPVAGSGRFGPRSGRPLVEGHSRAPRARLRVRSC